MKKPSSYILTESPEGPDYTWCDIFQTRRYFKLHLQRNDRYFTLKRTEDSKVIGAIHFSEIEKGHFQSPRRATYGGPAIVAGEEGVIELFLQMVCNKLLSEGATKVSMVCPPDAHNLNRASGLRTALQNLGFQVQENIANYQISVDVSELKDKMAHNNRKRLKKCKKAGFVFSRVYEISDCRKIYNIILNNRQTQGFKLSMSWTEAETMIYKFPETVQCYMVSENGKGIAGAICLLLNPRILYTLFWGHLSEFNSYSPVVMLADGIYKCCKDTGVSLIDLGTAPFELQKTSSLGRFKERLGAKMSLKGIYKIKF